MSEDLLKMHDAARNIKNYHGVDIMVPHGVKIGDTTFPAYNKYIYTTLPYVHLGFSIPLENGHLVKVHTNLDGPSVDGLRHIPAAVLSTVVFPTEEGLYGHLTKDNRPTASVLSEHVFDVPRNGTTEGLASKIKEWAEQPTIGVRYRSDASNEAVPPEELESHLKKHRESKRDYRPPTHPHIIKVANYDRKALSWDYNILTEEFKNTRGGD